MTRVRYKWILVFFWVAFWSARSGAGVSSALTPPKDDCQCAKQAKPKGPEKGDRPIKKKLSPPKQVPDQPKCCCKGSVPDDGDSTGTPGKDEPAETPPPRAAIIGVISGTAARRQRVQVREEGFDRKKDALWVDFGRVDPSSIEMDEDGGLSFVIPPNYDVAEPFKHCKQKLIQSDPTKPRVRIGPIDSNCPPVGKDVGALLDIDQASFWDSRNGASLVSLLATALLFGFLVLLGWKKRWEGEPDRGASSTPYAAATLDWLIDHETNSLSIQRLQFIAWTAAALFAFLYTFYSLRQVQHLSDKWPELPSNVLKIISISTATLILGRGVKAVKGPEGAGRSQAQLRDLITSGDVVALDKVQLLLWTIVGLLLFLYAVWSQDPATLHAKIDDISDTLWTLSGISGAAYLGGKIVRGPGPVIKQIVSKVGGGRATFELKGINLSKDAVFFVDGTPIPLDRISGDSKESNLPRETTRGDTPGSRLFRGLSFEVSSGTADQGTEPPWILSDKEHRFTIENPDGQKAECTYKAAGG